MRVPMLRLALLLLAAVLLFGCASIMHGSKQDVSFQTSPEGAWVEVTDAMGVSYGDCETPCTINLKRKKEYHVKVEKAGYESADFIIERKTDGWMWGNLLSWGVLGFIIDFSNGAAYKLNPELLQVTLAKGGEAAPTSDAEGRGIVIMDIEMLNPAQRAMLSDLERIPLSSLK